MRAVVMALMCGVLPVWAFAQTAPATLPTNDAIISVGWAGSEHKFHDQRTWHGSLLVGLSGGHYWTDHLKTEVEGSWNSPNTSTHYENLVRQGGYTYALSDYRSHDVRVGVAQIYQFGRNSWVHPYIGIGADVVRRQYSLDRKQQERTVYVPNRNIPVTIPAASERNTKVFAEPFVKTGLKMYVTEKTFFNTDFKLGIKDGVDHVVWKIGMGIDF